MDALRTTQRRRQPERAPARLAFPQHVIRVQQHTQLGSDAACDARVRHHVARIRRGATAYVLDKLAFLMGCGPFFRCICSRIAQQCPQRPLNICSDALALLVDRTTLRGQDLVEF